MIIATVKGPFLICLVSPHRRPPSLLRDIPGGEKEGRNEKEKGKEKKAELFLFFLVTITTGCYLWSCLHDKPQNAASCVVFGQSAFSGFWSASTSLAKKGFKLIKVKNPLHFKNISWDVPLKCWFFFFLVFVSPVFYMLYWICFTSHENNCSMHIALKVYIEKLLVSTITSVYTLAKVLQGVVHNQLYKETSIFGYHMPDNEYASLPVGRAQNIWNTVWSLTEKSQNGMSNFCILLLLLPFEQWIFFSSEPANSLHCAAHAMCLLWHT